MPGDCQSFYLYSSVMHGCIYPARLSQTFNSAILASGSKAFRHFWKDSYSCFRPLTMLMVRADFDLIFCESDFYLFFSEVCAKGAMSTLGSSLKITKKSLEFVAKGDENDSQKVSISVEVTSMETKEVSHEKCMVSV